VSTVQTEALYYPEAYGVDVADRWKERLRFYPGGLTDGRVEIPKEKEKRIYKLRPFFIGLNHSERREWGGPNGLPNI